MTSVIFGVATTLALAAGEPGSTPDRGCSQGCYRLGLSAGLASADGDLDGESAISSGSFAVLVPRLGLGSGVSAIAGLRKGGVVYELRYERSRHGATLPGGDEQDATLQVFEVDAKWFVGGAGGARPFVAFGWIPFAQLDTERSAATAAGAGAGHLRRLLKAMDLAGGVEVPLGGFLVAELFGGWRFVSFDEARGPHMSWTYFDGKLGAGGWHALLGLTLEL